MNEDRLSGVMAQALATHIPGTRRGDACQVELGGGLIATCHANQVDPPIVQLNLTLSGGPFGEVAVCESFVGMSASLEESVVIGMHEWVGTSFPALHAALKGEPPGSPCEVQGLSFALFEGNVLTRGAPMEPLPLRRALEACPPVLRLLEALPVLSTTRAHLVSCFGARMPNGARTLEVKVDGWLWPAAKPLLAPLLDVEPWPEGVGYASFRQSAVLLPSPSPSPARPSWEGLRKTLEGLALSDPEHEHFGANRHQYQFSPPLKEEDLAAFSARGVKLPEDYEGFLTRALSQGAGPGYGLLPPHAPSQLAHLKGRFDPSSSAPDDKATKGTLALAHLGCGYFSLLVLEGPARGQVFADVRNAGAGFVRTHSSFLEWYLDWLDRTLTWRSPVLPVLPGSCALPKSLSSYFNDIEHREGHLDPGEAIATLPERSIRTSSGQSDRYFDEGDPVDLCSQCEHLRQALGISVEQLVPGTLPRALRT